MATVG